MSLFKTIAVVKILEISSAFYPEKNGIFSPNENFILPSQNTTVPFNGNQDILCGPSPFLNTLNCFTAKHISYAKSIPIPGNLSTTPIFSEDSWIIGTSKGFLFRVKARSPKNSLPSIDPEETELWGSKSRDVMSDFVPQTIYKEAGSETSAHQNPVIPKNYVWVFPTSSPFVGTPVVKHGYVYALTANQTLQAIDFETGKLVWSLKVAPDVSFYLENDSLRVTDNEVFIGTNRGRLLVLDPKSGNQMTALTIGNTHQDERFPSIVAAPLIVSHHPDPAVTPRGDTSVPHSDTVTSRAYMIVSNAMFVTDKISLETYETLWTYPAGSITTPLMLNSSTIILTTTDGKIVSLNEQTGHTNWASNLDMNSPLVDTILLNDKKTLLVATKRGDLVALDSATGKILTQHRPPIGSVVGYFFQIPQHHPNEACLSFSTGSFRCFKVKI